MPLVNVTLVPRQQLDQVHSGHRFCKFSVASRVSRMNRFESFDRLVLELRDRFVTLETGQEPGSPREWTIAAPTRMQLQPSGASSLTFTPLSFKLALSKPVLSPPGEESFLPFPHEQTGG